MSLTAVGFWLLYVAGVGAAMLMPLAGVLLYILVYHMNPEYQWWGQSVRDVGLRTSFTIVIGIAIGLVLRRPRLTHGARQFPLPIVLGIALILLAVASRTWGYGPSERGAFMADKIVKVMIFVLILIRCVRRPQHYQLVILAWLCGVFYLGYQAFGRVGVYDAGRLSAGLGGPDFAESSDLAVHLVASLPLIGAMFFMARRWWSRGLLLAVGALAVNTIVLTRTRNAIPGLAAMCLVGAMSLPRGYRLKGWAAIIVGGLLALQLADPGWWHRMHTMLAYQTDSSVINRLAYWNAALRMSADYPFGIGLGNFHEVVKDYVPGLEIVRSAHNTLLACLAEIGVLGLAILLTIIGVTLRRLTRLRREAPRFESNIPIDVGWLHTRFHLGWHAMALRTALVGYLVSGMFTTRLWAEDFWILIGLGCSLVNVAAYMRAETAPADEPVAASGAAPLALGSPDPPRAPLPEETA
jgi:O-antigen ligase